jgi:hypothetical protein
VAENLGFVHIYIFYKRFFLIIFSMYISTLNLNLFFDNYFTYFLHRLRTVYRALLRQVPVLWWFTSIAGAGGVPIAAVVPVLAHSHYDAHARQLQAWTRAHGPIYQLLQLDGSLTVVSSDPDFIGRVFAVGKDTRSV